MTGKVDDGERDGEGNELEVDILDWDFTIALDEGLKGIARTRVPQVEALLEEWNGNSDELDPEGDRFAGGG